MARNKVSGVDDSPKPKLPEGLAGDDLFEDIDGKCMKISFLNFLKRIRTVWYFSRIICNFYDDIAESEITFVSVNTQFFEDLDISVLEREARDAALNLENVELDSVNGTSDYGTNPPKEDDVDVSSDDDGSDGGNGSAEDVIDAGVGVDDGM